MQRRQRGRGARQRRARPARGRTCAWACIVAAPPGSARRPAPTTSASAARMAANRRIGTYGGRSVVGRRRTLLEYGVLPGQASRRRRHPHCGPGASRSRAAVPHGFSLTSISRAFMAEPETATLAVASLPSSDDLERATAFTREPFLLEGEDAATALAPARPRRRALDAALAELDEGAKVPSTHWRRRWSLLLGLDRLLSQDEPALVDGTVLSAHQVDALSGTLTALLAEAQRNGNGRSNGRGRRRAAELASAGPARARRICPRSCARTRTATRIRSTGRTPTRTSPRPPTTPTPPSASGSSTRPAPARPSPRSASSRRRAPAAS